MTDSWWGYHMYIVVDRAVFCCVLGDDLSCSICLCQLEELEEAKLLPCHHMFHTLCIQAWLNKVRLKRMLFISRCYPNLELAHDRPMPFIPGGSFLE